MAVAARQSADNHMPSVDGDVLEYIAPGVAQSEYFNAARKVIFINGMDNQPEDHVKATMALSELQMCAVIGVYNKTGGKALDIWQCMWDKNQFNGPLSLTAGHRMTVDKLLGRVPEQAARNALSRNPAQVSLFNVLRKPANRHWEIFAHSQGNLILSNVLQAIEAVDGPASIHGRIVNTFGSPSVNWPKGIIKREQGFTFDPITWLAGFDSSLSISKVGKPETSSYFNPWTHSFLLYVKSDPAFVVNRFRVGGWGMTFNMDEDGLAECLVRMGGNMPRVTKIFEYLEENHNSDSDDVALAYVRKIGRGPIMDSVRKSGLSERLIHILGTGWTSGDEKAAIDMLSGR